MWFLPQPVAAKEQGGWKQSEHGVENLSHHKDCLCLHCSRVKAFLPKQPCYCCQIAGVTLKGCLWSDTPSLSSDASGSLCPEPDTWGWHRGEMAPH